MLGRHHFLISVSTALALSAPAILAFGDPRLWLFPIFTGFGALLPDVDGDDAAIFHGRIGGTSRFLGRRIARFINNFFGPLNRLLGFAGKYLLYFPYRVMAGAKDEHRGVFHSVYAGLFSALMVSAVVFVCVAAAGKADFIAIAAVFAGLFFGFFLHLLEDSCTISGIDFLAPFGSFILRGSHSTNGKSQLLPDLMAYIFLFLAAAPFAIWVAESAQVHYFAPMPYWVEQAGIGAAVVMLWAVSLIFFRVRNVAAKAK